MDTGFEVKVADVAEAALSTMTGSAPLAPLVTAELLPKVSSESLNNRGVDYVLRCIGGVFSGHFIYVNRAGEIFGSDTEASDVTMYVQVASIAPRHAAILYHPLTCHYSLSDLGSTTGTRIRLQSHRALSVSDRHALSYGNCPKCIRFRFGNPLTEEEAFYQFLMLHEIYCLQALILHCLNGQRSLERFSLLSIDNPTFSMLPADYSILLDLAISNAPHFLPVNIKSRALLLVEEATQRVVARADWMGCGVLLVPYCYSESTPLVVATHSNGTESLTESVIKRHLDDNDSVKTGTGDDNTAIAVLNGGLRNSITADAAASGLIVTSGYDSNISQEQQSGGGVEKPAHVQQSQIDKKLDQAAVEKSRSDMRIEHPSRRRGRRCFQDGTRAIAVYMRSRKENAPAYQNVTNTGPKGTITDGLDNLLFKDLEAYAEEALTSKGMIAYLDTVPVQTMSSVYCEKGDASGPHDVWSIVDDRVDKNASYCLPLRSRRSRSLTGILMRNDRHALENRIVCDHDDYMPTRGGCNTGEAAEEAIIQISMSSRDMTNSEVDECLVEKSGCSSPAAATTAAFRISRSECQTDVLRKSYNDRGEVFYDVEDSEPTCVAMVCHQRQHTLSRILPAYGSALRPGVPTIQMAAEPVLKFHSFRSGESFSCSNTATADSQSDVDGVLVDSEFSDFDDAEVNYRCATLRSAGIRIVRRGRRVNSEPSRRYLKFQPTLTSTLRQDLWKVVSNENERSSPDDGSNSGDSCQSFRNGTSCQNTSDRVNICDVTSTTASQGSDDDQVSLASSSQKLQLGSDPFDVKPSNHQKVVNQRTAASKLLTDRCSNERKLHLTTSDHSTSEQPTFYVISSVSSMSGLCLQATLPSKCDEDTDSASVEIHDYAFSGLQAVSFINGNRTAGHSQASKGGFNFHEFDLTSFVDFEELTQCQSMVALEIDGASLSSPSPNEGLSSDRRKKQKTKRIQLCGACLLVAMSFSKLHNFSKSSEVTDVVRETSSSSCGDKMSRGAAGQVSAADSVPPPTYLAFERKLESKELRHFRTEITESRRIKISRAARWLKTYRRQNPELKLSMSLDALFDTASPSTCYLPDLEIQFDSGEYVARIACRDVHDPLLPFDSYEDLSGIPGTNWMSPVRPRDIPIAAIHTKDTQSRQESVWLSLPPLYHERLQPGDVFEIGSLEFVVLRFNCGIAGQQGCRSTMEDEESAIHDLQLSSTIDSSFFAVYDGHGGRECAKFVRDHLAHVFQELMFARTGGMDNVPLEMLASEMHFSLTRGFTIIDEVFLAQPLPTDAGSKGASNAIVTRSGPGCAAVAVVILGKTLWCANCGDARVVLSRRGVAVQLSKDHKPDRPDEQQRILMAGGFVKNRRVLGRLAVSRAFGDADYKKLKTGEAPLVVAVPEIRHEILQPTDEFLLLACDGLFDVFSSQEAVDFVRRRLSLMPTSEQDPQRVVQDLVEEAIHKRNSRDNVTAILISLKRAVTA